MVQKTKSSSSLSSAFSAFSVFPDFSNLFLSHHAYAQDYLICRFFKNFFLFFVVIAFFFISLSNLLLYSLYFRDFLLIHLLWLPNIYCSNVCTDFHMPWALLPLFSCSVFHWFFHSCHLIPHEPFLLWVHHHLMMLDDFSIHLEYHHIPKIYYQNEDHKTLICHFIF